MKNKKLAGFAMAAVAAASFAVVSTSALAAHSCEKSVKCYGVNTCKGKGGCHTSSNTCKGQNSCKGQGYVMVSKTACDQLGGTMKTSSGAKSGGATQMQMQQQPPQPQPQPQTTSMNTSEQAQ